MTCHVCKSIIDLLFTDISQCGGFRIGLLHTDRQITCSAQPAILSLGPLMKTHTSLLEALGMGYFSETLLIQTYPAHPAILHCDRPTWKRLQKALGWRFEAWPTSFET